MSTKIEQRYAVKFCFKLGKTQSETVAMLSAAYGESAMSQPSVHRWFTRFKNGEEEPLSQERSGRPATAITSDSKHRIDEMVRQDRRITIRAIETELGINRDAVTTILSELGYSKVCARWVPHLLTDEQRRNRVAICLHWRSRLRRVGAENFLKRVVTCDESWMHHYDPETKQESSIWKHKLSPRPTKAKVCRSAGKVMHLIFFDHQGIIYDHCLPHGQTITGNYYSSVLKNQLMKKLRNKRPHLVANGWMLHHDNAPAHTSRVCQDTLDEIGVELLSHPPYSPDLAPCDFFLFPELKKHLRGVRFQSDNEVNNAVSGALKVISKDGFWNVFEAWQKRWTRCIEAEGNYFESS
jgi:[histone H3]-lysine36 N-dimethyltransferase SETMAR